MTDRRLLAHSPFSLRLVVLLGFALIGVLGLVAAPFAASGSGGPGTFADTAIMQEATPVVAGGCEDLAPGVGSEPWIRTELYFGTTKPDGSALTDAEWQEFLDEEITPRFPAGLTVLTGYGQFLNSSGVIAREGSIVLIIFYPPDAVEESSASIEEIRDAYEEAFEQESVLRADSAPVCISF